MARLSSDTSRRCSKGTENLTRSVRRSPPRYDRAAAVAAAQNKWASEVAKGWSADQVMPQIEDVADGGVDDEEPLG